MSITQDEKYLQLMGKRQNTVKRALKFTKVTEQFMVENENNIRKNLLNNFGVKFPETVNRLIFITDMHLKETSKDDVIRWTKSLKEYVGNDLSNTLLLTGGDNTASSGESKKESELLRIFHQEITGRSTFQLTEEEESEGESIDPTKYFAGACYANGNNDVNMYSLTEFGKVCGKSFGSFTIGNLAKIIFVDTSCGNFGPTQMKLLEKELQDRDEYDFCILVGHWSFTWHGDWCFFDWEEVAEVERYSNFSFFHLKLILTFHFSLFLIFFRMLKKYQVDITLSGHIHKLQSSFLLYSTKYYF